MRPYLREKTSFGFADVPEATCYEAGYLVTKNAGWRSIRPVIDAQRCVGCYQCYLYCPDGVIRIEDGKAVVVRYIASTSVCDTVGKDLIVEGIQKNRPFPVLLSNFQHRHV